MSYITDPDQARAIYAEYAERGIPIARIGSSSYFNNEALMRAASEFANEIGAERIAISLFYTANYPNMGQLERMVSSGIPELALHVSAGMVRALVESEFSPYRNVDVLLHLDHGQALADKPFLYDLVDEFATVMFDASAFPFDENMARTKEYVEWAKGRTLVEGAVEEISVEGIWNTKDRLTRPEQAVEFYERTGVDFVVPNIGTESQKETTEKIEYQQSLVQDIYQALGKRTMIIHGVSSLSLDQLASLADDGVAGVNIWTRFARAAGEHAQQTLATYEVPEDETEPKRRFDPYDLTYGRAWIERFVEEVKAFLANVGYRRLGQECR